MYNHYIPQSDGSYRRSSMPDNRRPPQRPQQPTKPDPKPEPPPRPEPCPEPPKCEPKPDLPPAQPPHRPEQSTEGLLSFLKGLLPRQIDTADLMILFLLLLMNKDAEDGLSPMLTIALYFLL